MHPQVQPWLYQSYVGMVHHGLKTPPFAYLPLPGLPERIRPQKSISRTSDWWRLVLFWCFPTHLLVFLYHILLYWLFLMMDHNGSEYQWIGLRIILTYSNKTPPIFHDFHGKIHGFWFRFSPKKPIHWSHPIPGSPALWPCHSLGRAGRRSPGARPLTWYYAVKSIKDHFSKMSGTLDCRKNLVKLNSYKQLKPQQPRKQLLTTEHCRSCQRESV